MKIVSNCPLCEEKSLHVIEEDGIGTQQCINCGYATTSKFIGTKEDNEMYKTLPEEMQSWSKEVNDRIWIPSMITLPFGTLYPINIDGEMKWAIAEMVDIPNEEQLKYPNPQGGYYDKMYDTDNQKVYDVFIDAMVDMNEKARLDSVPESKIKLPNLKRVDG
jgi:Zn ribbon nucleic-acid-binding protein